MERRPCTGPHMCVCAERRVRVFAIEAWYRDRVEQEAVWRGELRERRLPSGPSDRIGLDHVLLADTEEIAIYSAGAAELFQPFLGRQVKVIGKLIDLSGEGGGRELWVGWIEPKGPLPRRGRGSRY
jgi:hypothetical protein